jgi:hypothetical protein
MQSFNSKSIDDILDILNTESKILDLKSLKLDIIDIDSIITVLESTLNKAKKIRNEKHKTLMDNINKYNMNIKKIETNLGIKNTITLNNNVDEYKNFDMGNNIYIKAKIYSDKPQIPIMQYGIIKQSETDRKLLLFRYGENDFVSCSSINIVDYNNSTFSHTICCINSSKCTFGNNCKYYHDPVLCPYSTHVQKFMKSHIIPVNPYFGHASTFNDSIKTTSFEDVHTIARYCAIMMLLINKVSDQYSKKST